MSKYMDKIDTQIRELNNAKYDAIGKNEVEKSYKIQKDIDKLRNDLDVFIRKRRADITKWIDRNPDKLQKTRGKWITIGNYQYTTTNPYTRSYLNIRIPETRAKLRKTAKNDYAIRRTQKKYR